WGPPASLVGFDRLATIKRALADATAFGFACCPDPPYFYSTTHPNYDPTAYSACNGLINVPEHQVLWTNYIPASEAVRLAGWEPVTYATTTSNLVELQRFGRGDTVYVTVWGPNPPPTVEIEVDSTGLGLTNNPAFSEIVSNTQITVTKSTKGWKLAFSMEQNMTRIIKIQRKGTQTAILTSNFSNANDVQLYPNPTKSIINLKSSHEIKSVELCDLSGKLIMKTIHPQNSVDVSSVQKGMYFLKISLDNGIIVNKIIKE
ncbi:MAG: T9SS type A sorting domain-containing protein, partial [Paludibacter sp.]